MLDDIKKRFEFPNAVIQSQVILLKALNGLNCLWKPLFQGLLPDCKKVIRKTPRPPPKAEKNIGVFLSCKQMLMALSV